MQTLLHHHWHHLSGTDVVQLLDGDSVRGLDQFSLAERQAHFGPNQLPGRRGPGVAIRFLRQFHQPLVYILLAAALVTGLFREVVDALVILAVVVINAIVGFFQEAKAINAIAALARSLPNDATVIREGQSRRCGAAELVPGDLVQLQSGDRVPADVRLLTSRELRIDESALTGESVPVDKCAETLPVATALADRRNMAYSSTLVTGGVGTGVVVATGGRSEIGQISELIAAEGGMETPLMRRIEDFSRILCVLIVVLAALVFLVEWWRGRDVLYTFQVAVALAVGAIPEGLPAAVTVLLAIGVSRMARRRAIVRRLPAVEALGSVTVICSDKTGTLTQNEMTVQAVFAGQQHYEVTGTGYGLEGRIARLDGAPVDGCALHECLRAGLLCNDAGLDRIGPSVQIQGDPTEVALLVAAEKAGLHRSQESAARPRIDSIPFESQRQFMATLHAAAPSELPTIYWKGSWEALVPACRQMLDGVGREVPLNEAAVRHEVETLASRGLRVLALARKQCAAETTTLGVEDVQSGLVFLGLQGMADPPRPEARSAVQTCQQAGVRVKMITGDHAHTAVAIARQLGLADVTGPSSAEQVLTGEQLGRLTDRELIDVAQSCPVFARVSPDQKLRLVQALQAQDEVVAMTGDGVNDAPALRRANVGVAMAVAGTEVAREAADVVLTDDNFATLAAAVEEGRAAFETLRKFIIWTLPTNGGQSLALMLAVLADVPLPLQPVQLLWINMTTAILLGLTLAFEPGEPGLMQRSPRRIQDPLVSGSLWLRIGLVSILLSAAAFGLSWWEQADGASPAQAWTVATAMFVVGQAFYLLNCRSLTRSAASVGWRSNPWMWVGMAGMLVLQLGFTYLPWMNTAFHSAPIGLASWVRVVLAGLVIYAVVGMEKRWHGERTTTPRGRVTC